MLKADILIRKPEKDFVCPDDPPGTDRFDLRVINFQFAGNDFGRAGDLRLLPEMLLNDLNVRVRSDIFKNLSGDQQEIDTQRNVGRVNDTRTQRQLVQ